MKRFLVLFVIILTGFVPVQAVEVEEVVGVSDVSHYFDWGGLYSGSGFPVDTAKNVDNAFVTEGLKYGEASTSNILGLVEIGDRGIEKAAKNGGIKKIYYVDSKVDKVYLPLGFIPIYFKQTKTIVYGE